MATEKEIIGHRKKSEIIRRVGESGKYIYMHSLVEHLSPDTRSTSIMILFVRRASREDPAALGCTEASSPERPTPWPMLHEDEGRIVVSCQ